MGGGTREETDMVDWSPIMRGKEFGFCSKCNRKALNSLRQRNKAIRFMFLKIHSGFCVESKLERGKDGSGESNYKMFASPFILAMAQGLWAEFSSPKIHMLKS